MRPTQPQRVHEHLGDSASMAGRSRTVLTLGAALVLSLALLAGLESSEYTLTLAIGALFATLSGGAWLLLSSPAAGGQRSISPSYPAGGRTPDSLTSAENLPDPMDNDMDMPL